MPSELKKPEPFDLAQLRHLYAQMVGGHVKDSAQAKRIAEGILGRAIEGLERRERQLEQYAADRVREALDRAYDAMFDIKGSKVTRFDAQTDIREIKEQTK